MRLDGFDCIAEFQVHTPSQETDELDRERTYNKPYKDLKEAMKLYTLLILLTTALEDQAAVGSSPSRT